MYSQQVSPPSRDKSRAKQEMSFTAQLSRIAVVLAMAVLLVTPLSPALASESPEVFAPETSTQSASVETNESTYEQEEITSSQQSSEPTNTEVAAEVAQEPAPVAPASDSTPEPAPPVLAEADQPSQVSGEPQPAAEPTTEAATADTQTTEQPDDQCETLTNVDDSPEPTGPKADPNQLVSQSETNISDETLAASADTTPDNSTEATVQQASATDQQGVTEDGACDTETTQNESKVEIINTNDIVVSHEVDVEGITGQNLSKAGQDIEDTAIDTGDVNVYANILNVLNLNLTNSEIALLTQNFNSLSGDLLLNGMETSQAARAQSLVTGLCTDPSAQCQSITSFTLTNKNKAELTNDVDVLGDSGNNGLEAKQDIEDSSIRTGNVNALVNVLNIVNANLVNSRWTIVSFNLFGDLTGDIEMPSELFFSEYMSVGSSTSAPQASEKVVLQITNDNVATINNNVNVGASTGANGQLADQDVEESAIETGSSTAVANVSDMVNTTLINAKWFMGMVNVMGAWSGEVFALPDQVALTPTAAGMSFFASTSATPETYEGFGQTVAESADQACGCADETTVTINNQNDATITNNVDLTANSGGNGMAAKQDLERSYIITGNTLALANILNFANTNLINADLYVGMVNIFGNWNGNLLFGRPDLAVDQSISGDVFPNGPGRDVNYVINYKNLGNASSSDVVLEWQYDPSAIEITSIPQSPQFSLNDSSEGLLSFNLGKVGPATSGSIALQGRTRRSTNFPSIQHFASISGIGPELNMDNNQFVLTSAIVAGNGDNPGDNGNSDPGDGGNGQNGDGNNNPPNNNPPNNNPPNNNPNPGQVNNGSSSNQGLSVTKTNDASGKFLKAGDQVEFTLTLSNTSGASLYNVIVHDTLRGPSGSVIATDKYELGTVVSGRTATISYSLDVLANSAKGTYTNTIYAAALKPNLAAVQSNTAISSFIIGSPTVPLLEIDPQADKLKKDQEETALEQLPEQLEGLDSEDDNGAVLGTTDNGNGNGSNSRGHGAASKKNVVAKAFQKALSGSAQGSSLTEGLAAATEGIIPTIQAAASESGSPLTNPTTSTLLIAFLIAVGYALASARQKMAAAGKSQTAVAALPVLPLEVKRRRGRPRKNPTLADNLSLSVLDEEPKGKTPKGGIHF